MCLNEALMVCADDGKRRRGWELYLDLERRRPEEEVQEEETGSGSEVDPEGCAEALLNKQTLLNESLWNVIKTTKAQQNL